MTKVIVEVDLGVLWPGLSEHKCGMPRRMIMEKSFSGNFLIRLDNHPSAESFNQLMNPCWKVSPPDGTILRLLVGWYRAYCTPGWRWAPMGIKGLCSAPLTGGGAGGTQRPTVQCIAMKVEQLDSQSGRREALGRMQQFGARCPPLSLLPRNPPTHTGEIPCLSRPRNISLTLPELNTPCKSCKLAWVALSWEPSQPPSLHPGGVAVAERTN